MGSAYFFLGGGERERCVGQRSLCKMKRSRELNASEEAGRKKVISRRIPAPPDLPVLLCLPEVGCGSSWIPGSGPIPPFPSGSWGGLPEFCLPGWFFFFLQSRGLFGHYFIFFLHPGVIFFWCPSPQAAVKCQRPTLPEPQPRAGDGPCPPASPSAASSHPANFTGNNFFALCPSRSFFFPRKIVFFRQRVPPPCPKTHPHPQALPSPGHSSISGVDFPLQD